MEKREVEIVTHIMQTEKLGLCRHDAGRREDLGKALSNYYIIIGDKYENLNNTKIIQMAFQFSNT